MFHYFLILVVVSSLIPSCCSIKSSRDFFDERVCLERKNYCKAVKYLENATPSNPKNADYHLNLSYEYANLGKMDKAWYEARQAVMLDFCDCTYDNFIKIYDYYEKHDGIREGETTLLEVLNILGYPDVYVSTPDAEEHFFNYGLVLNIIFENDRIIEIEHLCDRPRFPCDLPKISKQEERFTHSSGLFSIAVPQMSGYPKVEERHLNDQCAVSFHTDSGDLFRAEVCELPSEINSSLAENNQKRVLLESYFKKICLEELKKRKDGTKVLFQDFLKDEKGSDLYFAFLDVPQGAILGYQGRGGVRTTHLGYLIFIEGTHLAVIYKQVPQIEMYITPPEVQQKRLIASLLETKKSYRNEKKDEKEKADKDKV